jgi:AraC-like DNA-binding protein
MLDTESSAMQGSGAVAIRFSTDDVPAQQRVPLWRELLFQTSMRVDVELEADVPFRAAATCRQLPGLRILSGFSPPATYQRCTSAIEVDDLAFQFGVSGSSLARLQGREAEIGPGEAFVLPCGNRAAISLYKDAQFVSLRLPRAAIAGSVDNLSGTYCRSVPNATPALALLKRYIAMLDQTAEALASPALQHAAVTHMYDLIALTLGATRDAAEVANGRGVRAARLSSMKDEVVRRLNDRGLSVHAVAARHNVTPRYVQKLFEESGETFTEFLVSQRLMRASRLLADPQLTDRSLTSIASDVGFGDLSYFNRAFRRRFGGSPADVRASAALRN